MGGAPRHLRTGCIIMRHGLLDMQTTERKDDSRLLSPHDTHALRIDTQRLYDDFRDIQAIGMNEDGSLSRTALSMADIAARQWFADRIETAGLIVRDDDAGNLSGVLDCGKPRARTLLVGSHLDSVPNGGHYDGVIGVLSALECARVLRQAQVRLPFHLEVINFTDDEGSYMGMFGCRAAAGSLLPNALDDSNEIDNAPFRAALVRAGINPARVFNARRTPSKLVGYLEVHIEQGARLERAGKPIGVVLGIVGRTNYEITFLGEAGHSGTTDMYRRRDALRGAAQFITRAHDLVREKFGDGIFNCGGISVSPGSFNVIPSRAVLTIELRHAKADLLSSMETAIIGVARECAAAFRLDVLPRLVARYPAAEMHPQMQAIIASACEDLGLEHLPLYSYSGHSPQFMSAITPSGMLFVPSIGGISHRGEERTEWKDVVNGANVLLHAVLHLARQLSPRRTRTRKADAG